MALQSGWVLERYLGWRVLESGPGHKVLRLPRGPLSRTLVLATRACPDLDAVIRRALGLLAGAVTVVDFDEPSGDAVRTWAGRRFRRVEGPLWFGAGTFVIDLELPESELLARMAQNERQACRRPREVASVEVEARPGPARLAEFLGLYELIARARDLELPRADVLARMADGGDLWMARVADDRGVAAANLVYVRPPSAWYLYGARRQASPGWAGALAQWGTIRALKQAGYRWYDLGLVASRDPHDGIYRFKSALGGRFVQAGSEYASESALFVAARRLARWARRGRGAL